MAASTHNTVPTEEEIARRMLKVFVDRNVQVMKVDLCKLDLTNDPRFSTTAFEDGAKFGIQQGWFGFVGSSDMKLLPPGSEELHKTAPKPR